MSISSEESSEIEDLLGAIRDGLIDEEQARRLEHLVTTDPDARAYYLEYIALCSTLRHYQGHPSQGGDDPSKVSAPPTPPGPSASEPTRGADSLWRVFSTRRVLWLTAAAAAVLVCVLVARSWPRGGRGSSDTADTRPAPEVRARGGIAIVVTLDAVRWDRSDRLHPGEGTVLAPGRFRFDSGRALLSLFNGVTLTLEGPTDVDLISTERVYCRRGRLRARVPKGAEGFVIAAPNSAVVDLGTEFGMNIEPDGKSRVMVFEGAASAALLDATGAPQRTQYVEKSEAFELDPHTGRIASTAAQPEGFVLALPRVIPSLVLEPDYADAVLRSRPRAYWRFESLVEGGVPDEVAGGPTLRVSGPIVIDGGSRGNGCATFKPGAPEQSLSTDNLWELAREPGHAVELWFQTEAIDYTSLVGFFPPREMNLPDNRGRYLHTFLVELTTQKRRTLHKPASVRLLHRWPLDVKVEYNAYSRDYYVPGRWHHVVAQKVGDRMDIFFDGVLNQVQSFDADPPTLSCHLVVGRRTTDSKEPRDSRSFVGRLDELAIYDHPLSAEEVRQHHRLASQKFLPEGSAQR